MLSFRTLYVNIIYSKPSKKCRTYSAYPMNKDSIISTFFFTFPSAWPSNLMMPWKYDEGIISMVICLNTACIHFVNFFLMTTGILFCFLLASTSWKREKTCSMSSTSVPCEIKASITIILIKNCSLPKAPTKERIKKSCK
jgi:hypothetical protein